LTSSNASNTSINFTGLTNGVYQYNATIVDIASNTNTTQTRFITLDNISPRFTSIENQTAALNVSFRYDINATDDGVVVDGFSIDDTVNFSINYSTGIVTNATTLIEHYYIINVSVNDTLGNLNWSLWSVNVTPDTTNPNITINSPSGTLGTNNVTIDISFSDNIDLSYCSYNLTNSAGWTVIESNTITCGANSVEYQTISDGSNYVLSAFANDTTGNINVTSRTFSIDTSTPPSSSGSSGSGSGGGSTTTTTPQTPEEFDIDFSTSDTGSISVSQGDVKTFSFNGEVKHSITILTLTDNSITLLITSDPITTQINRGETKQIDMNGDEINDLEIKFISIINGNNLF